MQMECVGADFIFLVYGHLEGNCAVFLIQKHPPLWRWMHQRHMKYIHWIQKRMKPPAADIPFLGYAIKSKWCKGQVEDWVRKDFPDRWMLEDFFPSQPKWQLVGFFTDGSESTRRYPQYVERYSPSGPVDPSIFQRAVGAIWERIGVECLDNMGFSTNREMKVTSFCEELRILKELYKARGQECVEANLIEGLWADSHELFEGTCNNDPSECNINLVPLLPLAVEFLGTIGIGSRDVHGMNSAIGERTARKFAQHVRGRFPLLYQYIDETDDQLWTAILLGVD
jgi:hypothetical protein